MLPDRVLEERRYLAHRRRQELVARDEQHDEVRAAFELRPVGLRRQLPHALDHGLRVTLDGERAFLVARGFDRRQVGVERRLDVHDELPAVGHVHDHVGAQRALVALDVHLLEEVAVLDHAGEFREAAQRHLAPLPAHLRPAQRRDEVACLALQCLLAERHALDGAAERAEALGAFLLDARDLLVRAGQCLAHRREHGLDGLLALTEAAHGEFLLLAEHLPGELQEDLAVAAQGLARRGIEAAAQALEGEVERMVAFPREVGRGLALAGHRREFERERMHAAAPEQPADRKRHDRQQHEQDEQCVVAGHRAPATPCAGCGLSHSRSSSGASITPVGSQLRGSSSADR